jgi:hypothetical protein
MAVPVVEVIRRADDPEDLWRRLQEEGVEEFTELCSNAADFRMEPERVGWLVENATHILRLMVRGEMVAFAYVNVGTRGSYADLVLLCGPYAFTYGTTKWKASEVLVDKAMQLAKEAGKTSLRLEALTATLYEKVYKPMGFEPVPGKYLVYERRLPSGGRKTRRRKTKRRSKK